MQLPQAEAVPPEEWPYWLALHRAPGVGPVGFVRFLERFGHPRQVFASGRAEFAELGIKSKLLGYLLNPDWALVEHDLRWLEQAGHFLLPLHDPAYPQRLREIHDPPPLLFGQGNPGLLTEVQLAMVGARNPSRSGAETAREFARHLARMGLVITSGMALGIDAAAHRGALEGSGRTVAVTGTGLDLVYPAQHRELAEKIRAEGVLVSEYPPGTPVRTQHFPRRNRIISGLSLGTLVVEATLRSGSLITARMAAEQGREVFAIPGSIHNPLAKGCHALIKEGAKLVETAQDIVEELHVFQLPVSAAFAGEAGESVTMAANEDLGADYRHLLEAMGIDEPITVDGLVERSGLTAETVSSMLLILELRGFVASQRGGCYTRLGQRIELP